MEKIYTLKQIETPRLIIRPVQLGDEIQLIQAVQRSHKTLQRWMPWAKDLNRETSRDFIQKGAFAWASQTIADFPMVVILKVENKIIGASGYNYRSNPTKGLYEIGYWCDVDYQGKGYVTEYVNALTRYAMSGLGAKTVIIRMEIDNIKSVAVAERLMFINQGTKSSLTKENSTDYYFTCERLTDLPPLALTWDNVGNDEYDTKMIAWAKNELKITDEKAFSSSKVILKTPWSSVMAINTGHETIFLKHMPEKLSLEAMITKTLRETFKASVPEVISNNSDLHCFLMKDAGISLRTILKQTFNATLVCKAIDQFTKLQLQVADKVDLFLEMGVPDWRLDKLTDLFKNLTDQTELLSSDGLSESEIVQVKSLLPKVRSLCKKLSFYTVKETLVQCDFHDNNILVDERSNRITHIDLGEIVISHPFFSLVGCLRQMKKHYQLTEKDNEYLEIKKSCLKNFIEKDSEKNISDAFKLAQLLWFVYEILGQYRLILACDRSQIMAFQHGKLAKAFREFIVSCKNFNG